MAKAWEFLTSGYRKDIDEIINNAVFSSESNNMIISRDIEVYSLCEHHMVPFHGVAHVGYIPGATGRVTGLSKIARLVDMFAKRLQVQERLTSQIADALTDALQPLEVQGALDADLKKPYFIDNDVGGNQILIEVQLNDGDIMTVYVPYVRLTFGSSFAYVLAQVGLALATSIGAWINLGLVVWFASRAKLASVDERLRALVGLEFGHLRPRLHAREAEQPDHHDGDRHEDLDEGEGAAVHLASSAGSGAQVKGSMGITRRAWLRMISTRMRSHVPSG